jgi:hypothetical protein
VGSDTKNGSVESLFAVARGAAMVARRGVVDGFDACIMPDHCERYEKDKKKRKKVGIYKQLSKLEL